MITHLRTLSAILTTAVLTWLAVALLCYALLYRTTYKIYAETARDVAQSTCGRVVPNELIYTLRPGACRFANAEFDTTLVADADGFRNSPEHRGIGPVHLAVIGDSHAMGWGVEQHQKLASLIARDPRFTVRDLAMSSYGTARELIALQRLAPAAGVIVLQYNSNDPPENAAYLKDPVAFVTAAPDRVRDYERQLMADRERNAAARIAKSVANGLVVALATTWRTLGLPPRQGRPTPQRVIEQEARLFAAVLARFKPVLAGKSVVVVDIHPRLVRTNFAPAFRTALAAAGMPEVRVLDLAGTLRVADFHHVDDHMRPSGHARVAQRILAEFDAAGRLKPAAP